MKQILLSLTLLAFEPKLTVNRFNALPHKVDSKMPQPTRAGVKAAAVIDHRHLDPPATIDDGDTRRARSAMANQLCNPLTHVSADDVCHAERARFFCSAMSSS